MESLASDAFSTAAKSAAGGRQEGTLDMAALVLNTPPPPTWWEEVTCFMRKNLHPKVKKKQQPFSLSALIVSILKTVFPVLEWGRTYSFASFRGDVMAGLTLASLGIPQSIGYANLAKLDPQYGLYTSAVPPVIYAVMGTSRDIAIGPVAVVSLLLSSMLQKVVDPEADPVTYRNLVFTTTLFTGIFQASFGLFRLGFFVEFLSHAAIVGFMAGAAIVIGLQQLKGLFGLSRFTNNTDVVSVVKAVFDALHHPWNSQNLIIGSSFLILILVARFVGRKHPKLFWLSAIAPLFSVVASTVLVFVTRADKHGVKIIQHVAGGLNPSSARHLELSKPYVAECAKVGVVAAVIALTEAIAVGRSFASVKGYSLDGNKEMIAMGVMNVAGSLSSCYVATGSFSRTAVNFSAGCKTAVSNIVMAMTVIVALEFMTKLFYYTPVAILASIILSALPGLVDVKEMLHIWEIDKTDFLTCMAAFLGVLFGSVEIGLSAALVISFAKIILRSIRPRMEILGRMQGTNVYCSIQQYPVAYQIPGVLIIRIDSSFLCFMNSNFIRERIIRWTAQVQDDRNKSENIQSVVIDMSNVMNIDISGIASLAEILKELELLGIQVAVANPGWQTMHKMRVANLVDKIGQTWIFLTTAEAVDACLAARRELALSC